MSLFIQKFGGSSLATPEHILRVALIVKSYYEKGHQVVVVLSAMGDETDRLVQLMQAVTHQPNDREYAALLSSGEQISCALLSMALTDLGLKAASCRAFQIGLQTESQCRKSNPLGVDVSKLTQMLEQRVIPVIAGFQGVNEQGDITTLGRGGSDMTAVALAAFLKANECQIFTDVNGVYRADPRRIPKARLIDEMHYDEMLAFSERGARVLQERSVEMARKYGVPVRVLSSASPSDGTLIYNKQLDTQMMVAGIACVDAQVKVSLSHLSAASMANILAHMAKELIEYDMLLQHDQDMSFVISETELSRLCQLAHDFHIQSGMVALSVVGCGMAQHAGFAALIMQRLESGNIAIHSIVSTHVRVSLLIDSSALQRALEMLHEEFIINELESV